MPVSSSPSPPLSPLSPAGGGAAAAAQEPDPLSGLPTMTYYSFPFFVVFLHLLIRSTLSSRFVVLVWRALKLKHSTDTL